MTETTLTPRTSRHLFGHKQAEADMLAAYRSGRMHHAWLLTGPKGIGKATLAYRIARAVLSGTGDTEMGEDDPVFRRVAAGSHTDLLTLETPYDPEKDESKQEIPAELAREVPGFLHLTPAEGAARVVLIDSVDDMNNASANSILKVLEEPPAGALLLLVSHAPGRLLPTIRSRCRILRMTPPDAATFRSTLHFLAPELDLEAIDVLGEVSHRAPGLALDLHRMEALELYRSLAEAVAQRSSLTAFAEEVTGEKIHTRWRMLGFLTARLLECTVHAGLTGKTPTEWTQGEGEAIAALLSRRPAAFWAAQHARVATQFSLAARFHLDYKTVLISSFSSLEQDDLPLSA